eukprot:TRINITY_DN643_c0_g1_i10.p1 TRINITY_DN643_c0_g1~~TRINITY_DN643_c0_g1_i10.p1  ORF type:complete len:441 (+),score=59.66 TRINITY_DN643_c0_g1_i10:489-1811(+)
MDVPPTKFKYLKIMILSIKIIIAYSKYNLVDVHRMTRLIEPIFFKQQLMTEDRFLQHKRYIIIEDILQNCDFIFLKKNFDIVNKEVTQPISMSLRENIEKKKNRLEEKIQFYKEKFSQISNTISSMNEEEIIDNFQRFREELKFESKFEIEQQSPAFERCTSRVTSGAHGMIGKRDTMEDKHVLIDDLNKSTMLPPNVNRSFYAVYDGHSGTEVSVMASEIVHEYIAREMINCKTKNRLKEMRQGIVLADHEICRHTNLNGIKAGSTAAMALLEGNMLYIANLGDTEAILCRKSQEENNFQFVPILLTFNHKPENEVSRIKREGGLIIGKRVYGLAVSRALGDSEYKKPRSGDLVSREPHLAQFKLTPNDELLIIACDGLWDVMSYQEATDLAVQAKRMDNSPEEISHILAQTAFEKGSTDNISVVIVQLNWMNINNERS